MIAKKCPFCNPRDIVYENKLAFAIRDKYPVSLGHLLFIPRRHVESYFDLTGPEKAAISRLLQLGKKYTDKHLGPDGYNLGINIGIAAGQTIMHAHVHLIPRFKGDIADPRGGVRGAIPRKRMYRN